MEKDRYRWHFIFKDETVDVIVIEETHPDINFIKEACSLIGATLIDMGKFSTSEGSENWGSAVLSVSFPASRLKKVFRRVEMDISTGGKRVIPAFGRQPNQTNKDQYCFAFPDGAIMTDNLSYFRPTQND